MNNIEELNKKAEELKLMKDLKGLKKLCKDNGVDEEDASDYMEGYISELFTPFILAAAKLKKERDAFKDLPTALSLYTDEIINMAQDKEIAEGILKDNKNLAEALGAIVKQASKTRKAIPKEISKAAGIPENVPMGDVDKPTFEKLIKVYYTGE